VHPGTAQAIRDEALRPVLLSYVRERRCVLFVGAGLSRAAGYPGWGELMERVVQATGQLAEGARAQPELAALLTARRYPELADQCREILGRSRFHAVLRAELARPVTPPEATHRPMVQTPWAAIVTTNYDTLLEDAYALWSDEGVPKVPTGAQLGRHGTLLLDRAFFILKAHGTIHDEESLVLTSEDYRRITHANPAFQSIMAALLLTHAVVFVGYSLSDPNFRLLIESQLAVFGAQAPPRYAVMEAVGAQEAQILRRTAGIEAIAYPPGEHDSVAAFLGTIASAARPEGAPRRRAAVEVLRERTPQPALCLSLRPRDAMLDVEWFETTTDDLAGARVPLERRSQASLTSLPWAELAKVTGELSGPAMREVGELLARPFARLPIPFRPGGRPRLVVVDVPQELAAVPWEWMSVEGEPLCLAVPVCRTVPGFDDAARGRPFFHDPLRVLLVGDALAESPRYHHPLPGTRAEVRAIRALFAAASRRHHVTLLKGSEASYARVLREMTGGYDIVHLAGVAFVDGSGESVVPLHDGEVRASELAALLIQNPPGLLFVNEDYSGFVPTLGHALLEGVGFAYGDLYHKMRQLRPGLERVVARAGVGTFIGCMAPCREDVARAIALDFYTELLAGRSVADALFRARTARDRSEEDTALVFAAAGYPDARITSRVPGASPARRPPPRPRRRRSR
jgi:hypothetical protein